MDNLKELNSFYTDVEIAILSDYFGNERPQSISKIDIYDNSNAGVSLKNESNFSGVNLSNGVARLALSRIRTLGKGWLNTKGYKSEFNRNKEYSSDNRLTIERDIDLYPLYLFGIDWASPSDYDSFPEYYYLTWFPKFDKYVVTVSVSNKNVYGVTDFAIGWDNASNKRIELSHSIIEAYWEDVHKPFNAHGWSRVLSTGLVPEHLAVEWKNELWSASAKSYLAPFKRNDSRIVDDQAQNVI